MWMWVLRLLFHICKTVHALNCIVQFEIVTWLYFISISTDNELRSVLCQGLWPDQRSQAAGDHYANLPFCHFAILTSSCHLLYIHGHLPKLIPFRQLSLVLGENYVKSTARQSKATILTTQKAVPKEKVKVLKGRPYCKASLLPLSEKVKVLL